MLVVVPVAVALAAAGSRRLAGGLRVAWMLVCSALVVAAPWHDLPHEVQRAQWLAELAEDLESLGAELCSLTDGGQAFWAGEMRPFTFCPMPHYVIEGPPGPAMWKVVNASLGNLGDEWEVLPIEHELYIFGRIPWHEAERPCADSGPVASSAFFNTRGLPAELEPSCDFLPPDLGMGPEPIKPPPTWLD